VFASEAFSLPPVWLLGLAALAGLIWRAPLEP
jgi:hypothetical protein